MTPHATQELHFLSLGAGVQSTTVYLMACAGEFHLDSAGFADTQDEPVEVYDHLAWLRQSHQIPIYIRTKGRLSDDLIRGTYSTGQRFVSIPAFTPAPDGDRKEGRLRRQCTKEYKTEVCEQILRREILKLQPGRRMPKDLLVHWYFGISAEEARRAGRIIERFRERVRYPYRLHFPLIERFMTRADCLRWLEHRVPHTVPRSACVLCPFKSDDEWIRLRDTDPQGWARAVEVDHAIRKGRPSLINEPMFLHRSLVPLDAVAFNANRRDLPLFAQECEGMCGN